MKKMIVKKSASRHMSCKNHGVVRLKQVHDHVKNGGEFGVTGKRANAKEILFAAAMKHGGLVSKNMTKKQLVEAIKETK